MVPTTAALSIFPDSSTESSTEAPASLTFAGERSREAATPRNSEPYQAILSNTFSGSDSSLLDDELLVEFFAQHRSLWSLWLWFGRKVTWLRGEWSFGATGVGERRLAMENEDWRERKRVGLPRFFSLSKYLVLKQNSGHELKCVAFI